ncbi:transglycosylase SLT domain-containing protein [Mitsuaria sp. GD03876]|uniref:transglycosylase SLT domain-containing protein n=1 Tax=Mitsuaria sp. GD03876 TaxID=2975399 RepID=UPI002449EBF4|nr:transglycosylase SLT domain-containing protein [Mitsuaria sp. GD03876]MDH0866023.1 transglycosylase SLT domain-containing protein [Mitsuaria sp. GD03876]
MSVQNQPIGLDGLGQLGLQGMQGLQGMSPQSAADIQAKLTEVVMQILQLLISEIMKAAQQLQNQQAGGGQGGGGGGGGAPAGVGGAGGPQGAGNGCRPNGGQQAWSDTPPGGGQQAWTDKPPGGQQAWTDKPPGGQQMWSDTPPAAQQTPAVSDTPPAVGGRGPSGMPADLWQGCQEAAKKTGVDPYLLAAQMEKESQFGKALSGSPSAGDGLMQVEPSTRQAYAGKFEQKMGHAYDHNDPKDQIAMAGVILADKGGDATNMLQKYNGGDNWTPGTTDSYGREIKANEYAASVLAKAQQMKAAG